MKNILILSWAPISEYYFKKVYGFDRLLKKYNLIIYDVSKIIFKNHKNTIYFGTKNISAKKFICLNEYKKKIKKLKINLVINLTGIRKKHRLVLPIIKKKIKIVNFINEGLSKNYFYPDKIYYYFKYIFNFFLSKNYHKFNINLIGGTNFQNTYVSINSKLIPSHSTNYNSILINRNEAKKKNYIKQKTAVFLDSGFYFHPDFYINKNRKILKNRIFNVKSFSEKINLLFLKLNKMGYKVIFLSHPKVNFTKQKIYKYCKKVKFNTLEYIKYSDLVFWCGSSTIEFPIIYKKKIIIVESQEIDSYPIVKNNLNSYAKYFNVNKFNLDYSDKYETRLKDSIIKPSKLYDKYKVEFIKNCNSRDLLYSKTIENILK